MAEGRIAIALLAAGAGERFGGGKLDHELDGRALGDWAARATEAAGFYQRIIVTGAAAPRFADRLGGGWDRVVNPVAASGLASSIRAAAAAVRGASRLVIHLADMPFVPPAHLARLAGCRAVAFTRYDDGHRGVPAAFPSAVFPALTALSDGKRLADAQWDAEVEEIAPPSPVALWDIDNQVDLDRAAAWLRQQPAGSTV